jgi:hypothetical protein
MFTENEVHALLNFPGVSDEITELKEKFVEEEAEYLQLEEHDFLSLILLTPSIGIALANGSVSLFEEMALNKKARKLSKGGYWMKQDPVVFAMENLITSYDTWAPVFYDYIKKLIGKTVHADEEWNRTYEVKEGDEANQCLEVLKSSFIIVRFLTSFFMNDEEEDIIAERKISKVEFERVCQISESIGIDQMPIYKIYKSKLDVKK